MIHKAIQIIKEDGIKSFIRKSLAYMVKRLALPYAFLKIKLLNRNCTLDEALDFAFNGCRGLIKPAQIHSEISRLLKILDEIKPEVVLEIGTANGGTLFLFSRVASEDATIISIDLPGGKFGGGYPIWRIPLYKAFRKGRQKLYLIREDSHSQNTLEKIKKILNGRKIDFLFIDGNHTYEGVKKDFEMYGKLVERESNSVTRYSLSSIRSEVSSREGLEGDKAKIQGERDNVFKETNLGWDWNSFHLSGVKIIAFHDIVSGPKENVGGVPKFWSEIKTCFGSGSKEIVENWDQKGYGIGIIFKNDLL